MEEGQVEAGLAMKGYAQVVNSLTSEQSQQLRQQMKIQSILFTVLRQWMDSWNLGAGFDDTYTVARQIVRRHLKSPTPNQQAVIDELLSEDAQTSNLTQLIRQKVMKLLSDMLTSEDWQALAEAASQSISLQVLNVKQNQLETTVA
jgi:hypothetical protein